MGHQIIRQPDGLLAVFSTEVDGWVVYDATPDELLDWYAAQAAEDARARTQRVLDAVLSDQARKVYAQFTKTFDEANNEHLEHGHEPVDFGSDTPPAERAD